MENSENASKTLYILCIATNARYKCDYNDAKEFNHALKIYQNNVPSLSPLGFEGESYNKPYIYGMYPEFEGALEYFNDKVYPIQATGKLVPDDKLVEWADETIKKFGLKDTYDLSLEPNLIQKKRLKDLILPKQEKDIRNLAPEVLHELGISFLRTCQDFRLINDFMEQFDTIKDIVSEERQTRENLSKYMDIEGVPFGIKLLNLKDQGIIDGALNILDFQRFSDSKVVKEFQFGNKTYDLSHNLPQERAASKSSVSQQLISPSITR